MKKTLKKHKVVAALALVFGALFLPGTTDVRKAGAAEEYYFQYNNKPYYDLDVLEFKDKTAYISIRGEINGDTDFDVSTQDMTSSVIKPTWSSSNKLALSLERMGPGSTELLLKLIDNQNQTQRSVLDVQVRVLYDLKDAADNFVVLDMLDANKKTHQVQLKYSADNEAIPVKKNSNLKWGMTGDVEKENPVADVNEMGLVTAKGAGKTTLTISDKAVEGEMDKEVTVVVAPRGSFSYEKNYKGYGLTIDNIENYVTDDSFTLYMNTKDPEKNIYLETFQLLKGEEVPVDLNKTFNAKVDGNPVFGSIRFTDMKAGTYIIRAYADKSYKDDKNIPYFEAKVYVMYPNKNLVLNLGDKYDIIANSNIPGTSVLGNNYSRYDSDGVAIGDDYTKIHITNDSYVIEAIGVCLKPMKLVVPYVTSSGLFDEPFRNKYKSLDLVYMVYILDNFYASPEVEIPLGTMTFAKFEALSLHKADDTEPVTWSSSDPSIVKIDATEINALKEGSVELTAVQKANGIEKTAKVRVKVTNDAKPDVKSVELMLYDYKDRLVKEPYQIAISKENPEASKGWIYPNFEVVPEGAKIPVGNWVSSNDKVLKIIESSEERVVVQAVGGGIATIIAVNEYNCVIGDISIEVIQPVEGIEIYYLNGEDDRYGVDLTKVTKVNKEEGITGLPGTKISLGAIVTPDSATNKNLKWYIDPGSDLASVSQFGVVTILKYEENRSATLYVKATDGSDVEWHCNINPIEPEVPKKPIKSITLKQDSMELQVDSSAPLIAVVNADADTSFKCLHWESTNPSVADVENVAGVIKPKGNNHGGDPYATATDVEQTITAKAVGTAVIIARNEDGSIIKSCTVTVKKYPVGVKSSVKELTMNTGEYFYLDATVTPANAEKDGVKWAVWLPEDAQYVTVASNGRIEAKKATPENYVVWLEVSAGNATDRCKLTVIEPVTGIELSSAKETIENGQVLELKANVLPKEATNKNVIWSSSDERVATVDEDGKVTGIHGGMAVIKCETEEDGFTAFCIVEVDEKVTKVTVTPKQYKLGLGKTYPLTAEISNAEASSKKIEWVSSDESIATVDKYGEVKGISLGYATITARAMDGSGAEDSCEIRVVTEVSSMRMNVTNVTLIQGDTYQLQAAIQPEDATYKTANWESADETVALVDDTGVVTAMSPGAVWITAKARDESGKYCKCFVTVIAPVPATNVTTQVNEVVLMPGEKKTVVVKTTPANTTDSLTWTSMDESIARVNAVTGEITAVSPGNTSVIVMTDSGKKATVNVIVIGLSRTSIIMDYYSTGAQLYVEGTTDKVRWYSSNRRVVEVSANGTLISRGTGTATVEARVNGRTLTCTVRVVAP